MWCNPISDCFGLGTRLERGLGSLLPEDQRLVSLESAFGALVLKTVLGGDVAAMVPVSSVNRAARALRD